MKRTKQRRPSFVITVSILATIGGCKASVETEATDGDAMVMKEASTWASDANSGLVSDAGTGGCDLGIGSNPPPPFPGDCPKNPPTAGAPCTMHGGSNNCVYEGVPSLDPDAATPTNICGVITCNSGTWCGAALDPTCVFPAYYPTVTWRPPTSLHQSACTAAQVSALVDCLGGLPDAATCNTFGADAANKTCITCAATPSTAAAYGPLVEGAVTITVNEAGCIALASGDTSTAGCGAKLEALSECEDQACAGGGLASPLAGCNDAADQTVCKAFADDALCAAALEAPGGVAAECIQSGATFTDNAKAMVTLFCGAPITDGGDGG